VPPSSLKTDLSQRWRQQAGSSKTYVTTYQITQDTTALTTKSFHHRKKIFTRAKNKKAIKITCLTDMKEQYISKLSVQFIEVTSHNGNNIKVMDFHNTKH
jgi:hypothetical protein